ncbi:hypothetical protein ABZ135_04255 [Streptomyces sp. NPDC006339]|uniref:hypothetical protein n=1 Tax=Streptomyces sp. NPDC006339 TaxID=3156755 RepID=UPI0033B46053
MSPLPMGRRPRTRKAGSRGRTPLALVALVLTVLASLIGGAATAAAVTAPATTASPAAPHTAPRTPQAPATKQGPASPSAEAAREIAALTAAAETDTCAGALAPDTVHTCAELPAGASTEFTLDAGRSPDVLYVQLIAARGQTLEATLTAPGGSALACERLDSGYGELRCPTTAEGVHTLRVRDGWGYGGGFSVSWTGLLGTPACTAVSASGTTLGAPEEFTGSLAAGAAGHCYALPLAAGDVLRAHVSKYWVLVSVHDATGAEVCTTRSRSSGDLDCALTGTAPYRVLVNDDAGRAHDYTLSFARLSRPAGCPAVQPQTYGTVPDASSTARCRLLHVPAAGPYVHAPVGEGVTGRLFKADGTAVCAAAPDKPCELAIGDYTWARDGASTGTGPYGIRFHATRGTEGCTATRDDGFASGPATGTFTGAGQSLCRSLPTSSGRGLYLVDRATSDGAHPDLKVFDAKGVPQCANEYAPTVCKLTGIAPFHVVLAGPESGTYRLVVQRTGEAAGCTPWAQSAFGATWGAEVRTDPQGQRTACLSVPAAAHSTAEMLDYANDSNQANASVLVHDSAGNKVCGTGATSTAVCAFTSGTPYTALLSARGYTPDTYRLVRRDVSATATCAAPASLTVGGASTGDTFTSALDSMCLRVTAAATDKMMFSVRTPGAAWKTGAMLGVTDAKGTIRCLNPGATCRVTGSTSYVVFALASGYNGTAIPVRLDTWRMATSAGWAPQCTADTLSPAGFPLRSGTFTETGRTAYCAVIDMKPNQAFEVVGTDSATGTETAWTTLLADSSFDGTTDLSYQCSGTYGQFRFRCLTTAHASAGRYVFLLRPGTARAPLEYSLQGVCDQGCSPWPKPAEVTRLSSTSGPAGTAGQVVLYGTGLTLGTEISLRNDSASNDSPMNPTVSVNAEGTALTVLLGARDLPPGTYDLVVDGSTQLRQAYTVTAPPTATPGRFVPVEPTRFLDTRSGLGVPKARVGAGGTVKLKVAGVQGVPATGVTAVVMNVTAVAPTGSGFITVYPDGEPRPAASSLNYTAPRTLSNLVTVAVRNGSVNLYNSSGAVDLIADVAGYYTTAPDRGSAMTSIEPTRFLDTRSGLGAPKARVGAGGTVKLKVAGVHGVPATGVTAVVMNVTAVAPTANGFVTVHPDGRPLPAVSNINYTAGRTLPNLVVVPVVNGTVALRNSAGTVDLLADVTGYFSGAGAPFTSTVPTRLLDTRAGLGARAGEVGPGGVVSIQVGGVHGVPAADVKAVVLNVTVTGPTSDGFLRVHPHGRPLPGVSNLNFTKGETISNLVVVPVVDGRVSFVNHSGATQVIADLNGYYAG